MVLKDAFSAVLIIARELAGDQAVKQAISDDIALVESKAAEGIDSLEAHVADWFGKHYALPAPQPAPAPAPAAAAPAYAAPAETAPAETVAADSFTPADAAAPVAADGTAVY